MKLFLRRLALAAVVTCATFVIAVPAHATLSGSDPRPNLASASQSVYLYAAMAALGL